MNKQLSQEDNQIAFNKEVRFKNKIIWSSLVIIGILAMYISYKLQRNFYTDMLDALGGGLIGGSTVNLIYWGFIKYKNK